MTFRGFRHERGTAIVTLASESFEKKSKSASGSGNELNVDKKNQSVEETTNFDASKTTEGERFSQCFQSTNENKNKKSFEIYLKRKEARATAKRSANKKVTNPEKTSSLYTN